MTRKLAERGLVGGDFEVEGGENRLDGMMTSWEGSAAEGEGPSEFGCDGEGGTGGRGTAGAGFGGGNTIWEFLHEEADVGEVRLCDSPTDDPGV
jgi:hypothetical protein